jgi:hypothetical protein
VFGWFKAHSVEHDLKKNGTKNTVYTNNVLQKMHYFLVKIEAIDIKREKAYVTAKV